MNQWDRHREQIERDLTAGIIGNAEYNQTMKDIDRDEREAAHERAEDAYLNVLDDSGYGR